MKFFTGTKIGERIACLIGALLFLGSGSTSYGQILFKNNGQSTLMTIAQNGKVGIGHTNPTNKLDLAGSMVIGPTFAGSFTANQNGFLFVEKGVGIGTTNVTDELTVNGGARIIGLSSLVGQPAVSRVAIATSTGVLNTIGAGNTSYYLRGDLTWAQATGIGDNLGNHTATTNIKMSSHWLSNDGNNEGIFVDPNGRVGLGSGITNPMNVLDVEGGAVIGATYSGANAAQPNGLLVQGQTGIGTPTPKNMLDVEGGVAIGARYAGNVVGPTDGLIVDNKVGIGVTNPTAELEVNGGAKINSLSAAAVHLIKAGIGG